MTQSPFFDQQSEFLLFQFLVDKRWMREGSIPVTFKPADTSLPTQPAIGDVSRKQEPDCGMRMERGMVEMSW